MDTPKKVRKSVRTLAQSGGTEVSKLPTLQKELFSFVTQQFTK